MNLTVSDLSRMLSDRAEDVCMRFFPQAKRINGHIVTGNLDGEPGDSLKVELSGPHRGKWKDWATGDHGDLLDLWCHATGATLPFALPEVRSFLGVAEPQTLSRRTYKAPPSNASLTPPAERGKALQWLMRDRKLHADIVERFQVQVCKEKKAVVFPSFSPTGELINRSYRTLEGEKSVWQEKGAAPSLFGWHALNQSAFKERKILICEGQIDAMTWTQWGFNALSVPNGSGQTWIDYEWDNLACFDTIYLAFDQDSSGRENCDKSARRLGLGRCLMVNYPNKDANDCLKDGNDKEDAAQWIADAKPLSPNKLLTVDQMESRLEAAFAKKNPPFTLPFFKFSNEDEGMYFRPAEVTVWTGETSAGKSTFLNYVVLSVISEAIPCYIASFEAKVERTLIKLLKTIMGGESDLKQAKKLIQHYGPMISMCDVVGYIAPDPLFEQMQFSFQRYGARHFFIDSLMRIEGLEEEYEQQGKFLNRLQEFAKSTDAHIHLVAHTKKIKEGDRPGKQDVKGSSLIANNADNIVSVRRNKAKDEAREAGKPCGHMHDTEVSVIKQRETGWQGTFRLKYDISTGAFGKL